MALYLDTRGNTTLGIGICGRCSIKMPLDELQPDPNYPGLMVCKDDLDNLDPYRLPARETEKITLPFVRPDSSLAVSYSGSGTVLLPAVQIFGIGQINPARPWQASTLYALGDSITPENVDLDTTTLPQNWWLCIMAGTSGATAPDWPTEAGVVIGGWPTLTSDAPDFIQLLTDLGLVLTSDNTGVHGNVVWLNLGIYPV